MTAAARTPIRLLGAALLALALAACASPVPPKAGIAMPAAQPLEATALARIAADSTPPAKQSLSGLRLLPGGDQALDARLALARHAERTLDLQYYVLADDTAGRQLVRALREASLRGVHVRLLLDDLHSTDAAALLDTLAAHERVEVRLFNPLALRVGSPMARLLFSPGRFEQLHRRMHNKLVRVHGVPAREAEPSRPTGQPLGAGATGGASGAGSIDGGAVLSMKLRTA